MGAAGAPRAALRGRRKSILAMRDGAGAAEIGIGGARCGQA
jgi:hypothetical protein